MAPKHRNAVPSPKSQRRTEANRRNAQKSTVPNNTTSTPFNAVTHGLLSAGITELDDADLYRRTLHRLREAFAHEMSEFLAEHIALQVVRLRRSKRLEAEYITSILNPAVHADDPLLALYPSRPLLDPGLPAPLAVDVGIHSDHRDAGTNAKPAQIVREDLRSEPAGEGDTTKESA